MPARSKSLLLLAALPWVAACANNQERIRLEAQIEQLRQQIDSLREAQQTDQAALQALRETLPTAVESRLEAAEHSSRRQSERLEASEQAAQALVRRIDDLDFKLAALGEEIRSLRQTVIQSRSLPLAPGAAPGGEPAGDDSDDSRKPDEIYSAAYSEYQRGNYASAMREFRILLNRYPQADLAEYALYWLGESLFALQRYPEAVAEFDRVLQRFPHGDRAPAAFLRKGLAYVEMNQIAQGVVQLQRLIEEFPRTREAEIARAQLENLGLKGGGG
ncbi:MAG TPA: tol-pal system protein YbgF [Acidobacteriota bacterium]